MFIYSLVDQLGRCAYLFYVAALRLLHVAIASSIAGAVKWTVEALSISFLPLLHQLQAMVSVEEEASTASTYISVRALKIYLLMQGYETRSVVKLVREIFLEIASQLVESKLHLEHIILRKKWTL